MAVHAQVEKVAAHSEKGTARSTTRLLDGIERIASYSKDFLKWTGGRKFRNPKTHRDVKFVSLPPEEKEAVHRKWEALQQHGGEEGYSKKLRKDLVDWHRSGLVPSAEGKMRVKKKPDQALIDEGLVIRDVATHRGKQHVTWSLTPEGSKVWYEERGKKGKSKTASYPADFLRRVEHMEFHNPATGNKVKFVSLPEEEQAKWYAKYQAAMAKRQEQSKKPKRPTFGKARDAAFGALEEAGWSLKKGLKVPKAERDIDGDRVVLHFKPQAVWMEVRGKTPPRSLHTDIRDIDPKQWVSTLEKEAKDAIALEESFKAASTDDLLGRIEKADRSVRTAGPRWHDLEPEQREAMRHAFGEMFQGPLVQAVPVSGQHPGAEEPPPEPPPPAEVKKMLADRMRNLARTLMVAGTRQPRQQMIEIWKAFDQLLDQLDLLADQPGRLALRRRILMGLRQRIAGGM